MGFLGYLVLILLFVCVALFFLFRGKGYLAWAVPVAMAFGLGAFDGSVGVVWLTGMGIFGVALLVFGVPGIRKSIVSGLVMKQLAKVLPTISETERIALEAGTVWWDAEFFSGNPDWRRIIDYRPQGLAPKEQEFLNGPVEELCRMLDDWEIRQEGDLPLEIWDFIKRNKFFGMIIPEEHGGLGFSALMHSAVVTKVASRSAAGAVTVMVPNSLGPAELLLHYGTDDQKNYYLPRLARGEEIPCFALTEPNAGSDAASIASEGIVCKGMWEGEEVLGLRLTWDKRYITLGPIATVLGLAFQMRDPDHMLGKGENLGITCALIRPNQPGVEIGKRHDPLGVPFLNGPTSGRDVFVPLDCIIGGPEGAGQGWKMLMQCLAAGRAISLPSLSCGAAQLVSRVIGAYANVREQFNMKIGLFEGVSERVGRIAGLTYLMNAVRVLTASSVDAGEQPAVVSAIAKAYMTEMMRTVVNDGMDVQAGAAICDGPRNTLARSYSCVPIGITVEGANILTRSMIIYGQGALRCHPWVRGQVEAVDQKDLAAFDRSFFGHVNFTSTNAVRSFVLGLTNAAFASSPVSGPADPYLRAISRYSAGFATLSDASMAVLGGSLKRKEMISGRLADALAWMYLTSCTAKTFIDREQPANEKPLLDWACQYGLYQIQEAMLGVIDNFPSKFVAMKLRFILFPPGSKVRPPSDRNTNAATRALLENPEIRDLLSRDIYHPAENELGLGILEVAYRKSVQVTPILNRVKEAVRDRKLDKAPRDVLLKDAVEKGIISREEHEHVLDAEKAGHEAIAVDAFEPAKKSEPVFPHGLGL